MTLYVNIVVMIIIIIILIIIMSGETVRKIRLSLRLGLSVYRSTLTPPHPTPSLPPLKLLISCTYVGKM